MEGLIKQRKVYRGLFTRVANKLRDLLGSTETDILELEAHWELLQEKMDNVKIAEEGIYTQMLTDDAAEDELLEEAGKCDEYRLTFNRLKAKYSERYGHKSEFRDNTSVRGSNISENTRSNMNMSCNQATDTRAHKFKLPRIELAKFSGDIREWLQFWSQFKKINDSTDITNEDKFQYLLSSISPNTRARDLVESFPPTAENYPKAIERLKSRFGREDLLIEVYVRELLKLVMNYALSSRKGNLAVLYDKIESQLRALETLGITIETCTALLYPLVESCLPEDLLRVWQRSSEFKDKSGTTAKSRLSRLMQFLQSEVEGEERVALAVGGFSVGANTIKKSKYKEEAGAALTPTSAGLMTYSTSKCVFCDGSHNLEKCFKAQKMNLDEKKKILTEKRACFKCAKTGHLSRRCQEKKRCSICNGQHIAQLCPELNKSGDGRGQRKSDNNSDMANSNPTEMGLANWTDTSVFLQTLVVKIRGADNERKIRAIIDTGSQRSYLLKSVARDMKYEVKRTRTVIHSLFGGKCTTEQTHSYYDARLCSIDGNFACKFEVLDQAVICGEISPNFPGVWTRELNDCDIHLTDTQGDEPISLLIGADVAGKLYTGKKETLACGLTTIETSLGWVLMGKIPARASTQSTTMTVTCLLGQEHTIYALWQLDVLGICDPIENKSQEEMQLAAKELFVKSVRNDKE